jgi:plastocyanin
VRRLTLLTVLAAVPLLAGCGGSSGSSTSTTTPTSTATAPSTASTASTPAKSSGASEGQALSLAANAEGQLKYDKSALTANAGKVSIDFTNMSPLDHNVTVESASKQIVGATPTFQGGSKVLSLNLKPGVYKFFCSVPGHRMAGMEGTLTVK